MKQLRYLKNIDLYYAIKVKQPNGAVITTDSLCGTYSVQFQELTDEVSATLYGAEMDKMYRISSYGYGLEAFLLAKTVPTVDNLSEYFIVSDDKKYKIKVVKNHWIDIEFEETYGSHSV